jgi:sorting nexin-9/18/33
LAADHKMESSQLSDVVRRTDVISYALLAEINHFHSERAIDFRLAMQNYIKEQISFYQKVSKLCTSLQTCAFAKMCPYEDVGCSVAETIVALHVI